MLLLFLGGIVRLYRKHRPLVVFAQDRDGEYGHWQHKLTSQAAVEAFALAADPTFDPDSAARYGTWQVQKVYLHLYPENELLLDADAPLAAFDGQDAFTVAKNAYRKHVTQQRFAFAVERNDGRYPFNRFGMAAGVVAAGEDAFDNIDPTLLAAYVPPTPTPTDMPTAPVTEAPTPSPTGVPSASPFMPPSQPDLPSMNGLKILWTVIVVAVGACLVYAVIKKRKEAR